MCVCVCVCYTQACILSRNVYLFIYLFIFNFVVCLCLPCWVDCVYFADRWPRLLTPPSQRQSLNQVSFRNTGTYCYPWSLFCFAPRAVAVVVAAVAAAAVKKQQELFVCVFCLVAVSVFSIH